MPLPPHPHALAEDNFEYWAMRQDVMERRARGESHESIAKDLGVQVRAVHRWIKEVVDEVRLRSVDYAEEMFVIHSNRLESLYQRVQKYIDEMVLFDEKMFRIAVLVLERQSKLLGLDKAGKPVGADAYEWLKNATPDQLIQHAKDMGLRVPEKFSVPVHMGTPEARREAYGSEEATGTSTVDADPTDGG
jgi:hypothetical protein